MNLDELNQQIEELRSRFAALLQRTEESPISQQELLHQAFKELDTALEKLKVALDELHQQNSECKHYSELADARNTVEAKRQRYQDLFEQAPDGYLVTDVAGSLHSANRAAAGLPNVEQKFLVGKPLDIFFSEEVRRVFLSKLAQRSQVNKVQEWEVRLIPRDGKPIEAALTVTFVCNQEGIPVALRVCMHDTTDRKVAESAMLESDERLRLLVENAQDYAIITLDTNGYVTSWNVGAESILGYQSAEVIGQHSSRIFTPEDRREGEDKKELRTAVVVGRASEERWHIRADGTRFWASGSIMALRDSAGNLRGFSKIMRDMTLRKQALEALRQSEQAATAQVENLEKLNRLKDDCLSTVSHELRTPISNMKVAIQMMQTAPAAEQQSRYLQLLQAECDREAELINTLLDLQQLEAASYSISLETVSLQDWLPSIIEPFQLRTQASQQLLRVDIPSGQLEALLSDRASLGRVLAELLNNACKYTPAGGEIVLSVRQEGCGEIGAPSGDEGREGQWGVGKEESRGEVSAGGASGSPEGKGGGEASLASPALFSSPPPYSLLPTPSTIFTISNSVEIPAAEVPHIFEKFYRVPNANPWQQRGTGLGLALVQKLVEQLSGTISVESVGGWTTFTIQLPTSPKA